MGSNSRNVIAIARVGRRSPGMTEGSREFCSELETVSLGVVIIPAFIISQWKSHRE